MQEIALHILDIVQNSVEAESRNVWIDVQEIVSDNILRLSIRDDGKGIPDEIVDRAHDPYYTSRTTRKVGMGLSLLKYHAELTGGGFRIQKAEEKGTLTEAWFAYDHVDRQPLGDIVGVLKILMRTENMDFVYLHTTDKGSFQFSTREAREVLEVDSLSHQPLVRELSKLIAENLTEIGTEAVT